MAGLKNPLEVIQLIPFTPTEQMKKLRPSAHSPWQLHGLTGAWPTDACSPLSREAWGRRPQRHPTAVSRGGFLSHYIMAGR